MADASKLAKVIKMFEDVSPALKKSVGKPSSVANEELMFQEALNKFNRRRAQSKSPELTPDQFRKYRETLEKPVDPLVGGKISESQRDILFDPELSGQVDYMRKASSAKQKVKAVAPFDAADMGPLSAGEQLFSELQDSPVGKAATYWNKVKGMLAEKAARQMDLTGGKDPQFQSTAKDVLSTGLDPINLIPGAGGIAAGALQMLGKDEEEQNKKKKP